MESVRAILAAHPAGISRAGILAWAQLRIDPDFDEARLDADLAALGHEVVERDGFLWLAGADGAPADARTWTVEPESPAPASGTRPGDLGAGATPWPAGEPGGSGTEEATPREDWYERTAVEPVAEGPGASDGPTGWRTPQGIRGSSGIVGSWAARIVSLAVAAGFLIASLVGLLGEGTGPSATPVPTGPAASMVGSLGPYEEMSVGDCIAIPAEQEFSEVRFVPCSLPHDAEVFYVGARPGSDAEYPDEAAFEAYVDEVCTPAFTDYTGSAYDAQSTLEVGWFMPTEDTWRSGEHTVHCYLTMRDGSTTTVSWRGANP